MCRHPRADGQEPYSLVKHRIAEVFYYKMKGDYNRLLAESATRDAKSKVAEEVVDVPVVLQRKVVMIQRVQKTGGSTGTLARSLMCQWRHNAKFSPFKLCRKRWKCRLHRCVVLRSRLIISSALAESTFPSLCLLAQASPPPCVAFATGHRLLLRAMPVSLSGTSLS